MNIAVVIYFRHLRRCGLPLFLKGRHPPICLNVSMFTQIIRDPAEEVSTRLFYKSLQIAFPNNVQVPWLK